jgi:hypothetical protein
MPHQCSINSTDQRNSNIADDKWYGESENLFIHVLAKIKKQKNLISIEQIIKTVVLLIHHLFKMILNKHNN